MEWTRIKTMFIYLFTFLNILLIAAYFYIDYQNKSERYEEKQAIINAMKNDNIIVDEPAVSREKLTRISAISNKFSLYTVDKNSDYSYSLVEGSNSEKLQIKFSKPITNVNNQNYKDILHNFIANTIKKNESYVFEEYSISGKQIVYRQTLEGLKIYDNPRATLIFEVDDKGDIVSATQTALADAKIEQEQVIIPYSQVVQKMYHDNLISRNSKVSLNLGYYTPVSQIQNQVLIPTWEVRVLTEEGKEETYYVDAISMKLIDR